MIFMTISEKVDFSINAQNRRIRKNRVRVCFANHSVYIIVYGNTALLNNKTEIEL